MQNNTSATLTQSPGGKIFLSLPGKSYKSRRMIGQLDGDTLHVDRDPDRHLFRKFNSFGFAHELIKRTPFRVLAVHLPFGEILYTTKKLLLERGRFLNFKSNRLEKQIFLEIGLFDRSPDVPIAKKLEQNNNSETLQTELF